MATKNDSLLVPLEVEPWFVQLLKLIVLKSDKDAQIVFLFTYSQYAQPEDLFLAAEDLDFRRSPSQILLTTPSYLNTGFDKAKLAKLASFLYLWLSTDEQLDRKLRRKVLELARLYNPPDNDSPIAKAAKRFRLSSVSASYQKFRHSISVPPTPISSAPPSPSVSPTNSPAVSPRYCVTEVRASISLGKLPDPQNLQFDILKYSSSAIAKQMTIIDHELVSAVTISDLKKKIFHPEDARWETVSACSTRFNKVSFWVATQIVTAPNLKVRVEIIEKFIAISAKLYKYRNFHGVYQVLSGMHNSNVRRLRSCWKHVSQRSSNTLHRIEQAMSHVGNYSQYRTNIKECQAKRVPAVPLICLLLQDLTFINDGNEDNMSDNKVNFEKWTLFGSCMLDFSRLMEAKYNFHKNTSIKRMLLNDLLILPETLLMKHSYAIEARKHFPSHGASF